MVAGCKLKPQAAGGGEQRDNGGRVISFVGRGTGTFQLHSNLKKIHVVDLRTLLNLVEKKGFAWPTRLQ